MAFFRHDVDDAGVLSLEKAADALKSIQRAALASAEPLKDVEAFCAERRLREVDGAAFEALVARVCGAATEAHLDRDAFGALSAGFAGRRREPRRCLDGEEAPRRA